MKRTSLAVGIAAITMPFFCPPFALAQQPAAGERSTGLEEIIVTAQRREENLQKVPVAVTALSSDTLSKFRVTGIMDLGRLSPNFGVIDQGIQTNPLVTVRGITSGAVDNSVDPKVGMYLDGVYIGRSAGSTFDLAEIERVEVLRGPQGTLFGRNATAGAISLITAPPTGEFGLKQDLSVGSRNAFRARTNLNLPAWGPLSVKFSYLHDESDGVSRNLIAGQKVNLSMFGPEYGTLKYAKNLGSKDVDAYMVAARLAVNDALTIDYHFDYTDSETVGNPSQQLTVVPSSGLQPLYDSQSALGGITSLSSRRLSHVANATSTLPLTVRGHNLTLTWDVSDGMSLKSITAYRRMNQGFSIYDLPATGGWKTFIPELLPENPIVPFFSLLTARSMKQRQFSEELQFTVSQDAYDLVSGLYFFKEHTPASDVLGLYMPAINGVAILSPEAISFGSGVNQSVADNKSIAAYAQGTWHASEKLDFTLGLRRSKDKREYELIRTAGASGTTLPPGTYKTNYGKTNYTAIVSYWIDPDVMVYAKTATGYVAGGLMSGIPYDPEELKSYEIGIKSQFLDNRLRLNATVFDMSYTDKQEQLFIDGVQLFVNASDATIKGLEVELEAVPVEGLSFSASLGITDFKYKKFELLGTDVTDDSRNIYTPKRSLMLSAQYELPWTLLDGTPYLRFDAFYASKAYAITQKSPDPAIDKFAETKAHWIVDVRAGVAAIPLGKTTLNVSAWAKNLFDEDDVVLMAPEVINRIGLFRPGRSAGVDLTLEL